MLRAASAVAAMRCCSPLTCWSDDLHDLPLIERNWRLIGKAQSRAIRFNEHLTGGGPTIFKHVCQMGLEGIVSKRTADYRRRGSSRRTRRARRCAGSAWRMALVSAHPGLHNSAQMENPTKASTATLRTIIAIAPTSIMESRLAMRQFFRQSSDSVDLDHVRRPSHPAAAPSAASGNLDRRMPLVTVSGRLSLRGCTA